MTYQVLARKWRPQDFASLVGQEHVVTALGNALAESRIAQAYLFSGIRGVGKTTAARVLAKALNCERGPAANPCNECASCLEITSGNSMDVIEVDAATYSKVEQVRELTETLRYGPARGRYKVVVLDEVHRLSRQAFDALLKIVEEPPAHLVFIFATTEIDAVPATILSRCQEFQFRRVTQPVLAAHLRNISEAENITVSDAALRMIARAGEGSVRDSVAMLDQMATFGSGTISDEDAQRILGGLDAAIFQKLLAALIAGERNGIVSIVREIEANGWDPHNVYSQFLVFLRDALHLTLGGNDAGDLPEEEAALVRQTVGDHGYESLLQILQLLISSEPTVRRSEFSLLALEIAWLRAAELPKVTRLQDLLSGAAPAGGGGGVAGGGGSRPSGSSISHQGSARSAAPAQRAIRRKASAETESPLDSIEAHAPESQTAKSQTAESQTSRPAAQVPAHSANGAPESNARFDSHSSDSRAKPAPSSPAEEPSPAEDSSPAQSAPPCDPARLPAFFELLANRRQSLAAHVENAKLRFDHRTLLVAPPADDSLFTKAFERKANREALEQILRDVWGEPVDWRLGEPHHEIRSEPSNPVPSPGPNGMRPNGRPTPQRHHSAAPADAGPGSASRFEDSGPGPGEPPEWASSGWGSQGDLLDAAPSFQDGPSQSSGPYPGPSPNGPAQNGPAQNGRRVSADEAASFSDMPVVRTILSTFGGTIQSVETVSEESPQ